MAKPYSQDLRDRLVLAVLSGQSRRNMARRFDVSSSYVIKLMQQWETTGNCLPRKFGGHKRHALAEQEDKVRALVAAQPDLTITALWKKLTALKIKVGRSAVWHFLLHLKLTYKKKRCTRRNSKGPMFRQLASRGARCGKALILRGLFSSTGRRPT